MKTTGKPDAISKRIDVTNGIKTGGGFPTKESSQNQPKSLGAPKDVTNGNITKKDLNLGGTNYGKVDKIGK